MCVVAGRCQLVLVRLCGCGGRGRASCPRHCCVTETRLWLERVNATFFNWRSDGDHALSWLTVRGGRGSSLVTHILCHALPSAHCRLWRRHGQRPSQSSGRVFVRPRQTVIPLSSPNVENSFSSIATNGLAQPTPAPSSSTTSSPSQKKTLT